MEAMGSKSLSSWTLTVLATTRSSSFLSFQGA
jgi:hypothetical protein